MVYTNMLTEPEVWLCTLLTVFLGKGTICSHVQNSVVKLQTFIISVYHFHPTQAAQRVRHCI
jgi:hypothetical protein